MKCSSVIIKKYKYIIRKLKKLNIILNFESKILFIKYIENIIYEYNISNYYTFTRKIIYIGENIFQFKDPYIIYK